MLQKIESLRTLILEGKHPQAFKEAVSLEVPNYSEALSTIWNSYSEWIEKKHLGLEALEAKKNSLVYQFLYVLSQIEFDQLEGNATKKLGQRSKAEEKLTKGYSLLFELQDQGAIDMLFVWMRDRYPEKFALLLEEEAEFGSAPSLQRVLGEVQLSDFIGTCPFETTPEQITQFVIQNAKNQTRFISGWVAYSNYRERNANALNPILERSEVQYRKLITAGIIGGIISLVAFNLLEAAMKAIENQQEIDDVLDDDLSDIIDIDGDDFD